MFPFGGAILLMGMGARYMMGNPNLGEEEI
jgi:hypothetical protein